MRVSFWRQCMLFVFSILVGSSGLLAASAEPCTCGQPTSESYKWDYSKEAAEILNNIKLDSFQVRDLAAQLEAYDGETPFIDWRSDAGLLKQMRDQVNQMDKMMCLLRLIARETTPEQQAVVQRVVPEIIMLTGETSSAIQFLDRNPDYLWAPRYAAYATEMYNSADTIQHYLRNAQDYAAQRQSPPISKS